MSVLDQNFKPEYYFEEICRYPHGSYHEKPLSDYIVEFARKRSLQYRQYDNCNVIIYKNATPGYENHEPVILQAHIDMVCEKSPDSKHDFLNDPIEIFVEDNAVKAKGTTLGGDDGMGVAYILSILDDDNISHPDLECVFTVQEEVGCYGARDLDYASLRSKRLIGLDNMHADYTEVTSSGSNKLALKKDINKADTDKNFYIMKVQGLLGGHSAYYINSERANSIKLSARILNNLNKQYPINIASIKGGDKENAIPVYCETKFACDEELDTLSENINNFFDSIKAEYIKSDPEIKVSIEKAEKEKVLNDEDSNKLLDTLIILPNGYRHKSLDFEGLTNASENLSNINVDDNTIDIHYFNRAAIESYLDEMSDEIETIAGIYGYTFNASPKTPAWPYVKESQMRNLYKEVYKEKMGYEVKELPTHGGLETSYFVRGIPGVDIVCVGAEVKNYHTIREELDLKTFRSIYLTLVELLKRL